MANLGTEPRGLADVIRVKAKRADYAAKRLRKQQIGLSTDGDGGSDEARTQLVARIDYENSFNPDSDDGGGTYVYFDSSERVDEKISAKIHEDGMPGSTADYQVGNAQGGWTTVNNEGSVKIEPSAVSGQVRLRWMMPVYERVEDIPADMYGEGSLAFIRGIPQNPILKVHYCDGQKGAPEYGVWKPITNQ